MFSRFSRNIAFTCVLNDVAATTAAFVLAFLIRLWAGQDDWQRAGPIHLFRLYLPVLLAAVVIFPLLGYILGAYKQVELRRPREIATDIVKMAALGLLTLFSALFLLQGHFVSRSFLFLFAVLQFLLLGTSRWLLLIGGTWLRSRPEQRRHFIIVGSGNGAAEVATLLEAGERFGLSLLGFIHIGNEPPTSPAGLRRAYSVLPKEQLVKMLHNRIVDEVVFAVEKEELLELEPLMQQCEQEGVRIRIQLDFLPKGFSDIFVEHLAHVPLLTLASTPQNDFALLFKRTVDVILSILSLVVLSPLFLFLALLVKLTSKGPVLFRQIRCGLGGRQFVLLKFRSMVVDADELLADLSALNEAEAPLFKMRNDPRCTKLGRWMRMFSMDELPQLWNILRGDMSLVGPRPPLPQEVEQYQPWQRRRLRMRPGLTCLWALEGRSQLRFERLTRLDLLYIDNWSVWLDLKILIKTIPTVLSGRGAH
jgi:exopolysaccharide biosynthesis polyprenyl glycosylphosphotransferase